MNYEKIDEFETKNHKDISDDVMGDSDSRIHVIRTKLNAASRLPVSSMFQLGVDVSGINYMSAFDLTEGKRSRSILMPAKRSTLHGFHSKLMLKIFQEETPFEEFPKHVTPLMNEDQLWGCFHNFPELYANKYSPIVHIRDINDVPEITQGVLTRDTVTACLSYLKRTPILGDFVLIKLDLSSKLLKNLEVLEHYKYLVYLDLTSNLLTELHVLSKLLYLQFLAVGFNRLKTVLEYDTPQWFLTEVHYKHNSVMSIRDLTAFWSLTVIDLSHNNIKYISGLETLRYLRHLDLSFNHIKRLENLNHLRLLWLDVSYNNISSFEFGDDAGLWTLLHLEYLNLNENSLTSMKIFSGCTSACCQLLHTLQTRKSCFTAEIGAVVVLTRETWEGSTITKLQELHARNNGLRMLLEVAIYMRQMRRLISLDLRSNPICSIAGYKDVIINAFPCLLNLDEEILDPVEQRSSILNMTPDVMTLATRRLLRLLYIEQLSRALVSPFTLPADTREVSIIVLVGYEGVGKGTLARRLASKCSSNVELAIQHSTASVHYENYYIEVTRKQFDDMLLRGEFLTYGEIDGESYGLSRKEACVRKGKVRIVTMDLIGALMLKLRGLRPYLILATCSDKCALSKRQQERRKARNMFYEKKHSMDPFEISTLQVLLSGRIIINGILNEIINVLPDDQEQCQFIIDSELSIFNDTKVYREDRKIHGGQYSSSTSADKSDQDRSSQIHNSLFSLYKERPNVDMGVSEINNKLSHIPHTQPGFKATDARPSCVHKQDAPLHIHHHKSVDFSRIITWRGSKSTISETYASQDNQCLAEQETDTSGVCDGAHEKGPEDLAKPLSSKTILRSQTILKSRESDLWLAFLMESKLISPRELIAKTLGTSVHNIKPEDLEFVMKQFGCSYEQTSDKSTSNVRDDYEDIHRLCPGLFWDTVNMDNPDAAFHKLKEIVRAIVESQKQVKPMWDVDFAKSDDYPILQTRLQNIRKKIAPCRLFY